MSYFGSLHLSVLVCTLSLCFVLSSYAHSVVDILPPEADSAITMMQMTEKPDVSYSDIGGMDIQKQEIREAVELPLSHQVLT